MKSLTLILTPILIICFGLLPKAHAVNPPPDGAYPNFNTAEGQNALLSLTTGSANTAVGWFSLWGNAEGSFNTTTGAGALLFNTSDQNTAFGAAALLFNTDGFGNTAVGGGPSKQHGQSCWHPERWPRLRQHGRRCQCAFQQYHRRVQHGGRCLCAS
jgi:hypothetical protein